MTVNPEQLKGLFKLGGAALVGLIFLNECRFTGITYKLLYNNSNHNKIIVEPGHTAIKFSKFTGLGSF